MSSLKKYEFTGDIKEFEGRTLRRIRAVRDFGDVKAGALGGWIEAESNLSHDGTAWVYGEAWVFSGAQVGGEARVSGEARVYGEAWMFGEAQVYGEARVLGGARVFDKAQVYGEAMVYGKAWVGGEARVSGKASVTRNPITARLTRDPITATDNHIQIGCRLHTYEHWLAHYEEIGREAGYPEDDIAIYGMQLKLLNEVRMQNAKQ